MELAVAVIYCLVNRTPPTTRERLKPAFPWCGKDSLCFPLLTWNQALGVNGYGVYVL